jgi:UDP-GlcNAc:undecaprenyl-phosphate GlcNAc-1-phosphate transferase
MFVTMSLIPLLMRKAEHWQFVDMPDQRKVHHSAVPRIGGMAMVAGALIPIVMWLTTNTTVIALLLGIAVIFAFGVWDDRKNLNYKIKFLGQSIGVLIVIVWGGVKISVLPFGGLQPAPDYITIPLTFLFLLGITNAINLSDGLDGLAGGTTLLSFGVIAVLGYFEQDVVVVLVSIAILGSILGFLRFNTHPARIFMGDGGSQFLGFAVGVLAVMLTQRFNTLLSPALPLLLLGLPILDTLLVMGQRVYEKRSPFSPDRNHIHHKLLALGFDHYEAVFIIYLLQAVLVVSAYLLRYQSDAVIISLYLSFCAIVVMFFRLAHIYQWKLRTDQDSNVRPLIAKSVKRFRKYQYDGKVSEWAFYAAVITIPVFLLASALHAPRVSTDIGVLALLLFFIIFAANTFGKSRSAGFVDRIGMYVVCTLVIYLNHTLNPFSDSAVFLINSYIILLGLVVAVSFKYCKDSNFRLTTLDFLVIFIAFLIPSLPGLDIGGELEIAIAQLLVLFYAVELILSNIRHRAMMLKPIMLVIFSVFAVKALLLN